jgi:hypothetical protein
LAVPSVVEFQNAIRLDPSNAEAKANLELHQQNTSTSAVHSRERLQRCTRARVNRKRGTGIDARSTSSARSPR